MSLKSVFNYFLVAPDRNLRLPMGGIVQCVSCQATSLSPDREYAAIPAYSASTSARNGSF